MIYTAKTVYGGTSPIDENRHVNDLMDIFKKNGLNDEAKGLAEVVGCVASMERDLNKAISELTAVRRELSELRDGQKSPVKSMLGKAVDGVLSRLRSIRQKVQALKEKIIGACEQTVEAVKDKGISAANDIAAALDIKGDLRPQGTKFTRPSLHAKSR
jgi:vacuolar-type H+-ATPase subunit I/STV1